MARARGGALVAAAVAGVLLLGIGGWLVRREVAGRPGVDPDRPVSGAWQVRTGAFTVSDTWMSGPSRVVPAPDGCFLAVGQDSTGSGMAPAFWRAAGDCASAIQLGPSGGPRQVGDALPSEDRGAVVGVVVGIHGGYVALGRTTYHGDEYAYDGYAMTSPDGATWTRTARFELDQPRSQHYGPFALAVSGDRYVAVGQREQQPVAWTSTDAKTWRETPMPGGPAGVLGVAAGPAGHAVAVGSAASGVADGTGRAAAWVSSDSGATWRRVDLPDVSGRSPRLSTVVWTGWEYVAFGSEDGDVQSPALVMRSPDGAAWTQDPGPAAAGVRSVTAATVLPDGTVLAVSERGTVAQRPDGQCASAWLGGAGGWSAEDLGCQGVPTSLTVLRGGRVAGVFWSTLFLRDARPATAGSGSAGSASATVGSTAAG